MGTTAEIWLYAANGDRASELFEAAFAEIERIEAALSTYRPTSEISRINREAGSGPVTTDPEVFGLVRQAMIYSEQTSGAFDITVGPLVKAWGFFRGSGRYPSVKELAAARDRTGWKLVMLNAEERSIRFRTPGVELDPGGIGKGWALDSAARLLRRLGIQTALLGLGQSSYLALGAPPGTPGWAIHIPDPESEGTALSTVFLRDRSLSTSGSTDRYFERDGLRYGHILDPRTGMPAANDVAQVTVTAATATECDALSTALFVLGAKEARDFMADRGATSALIVLGGNGNRRLVTIRWPWEP